MNVKKIVVATDFSEVSLLAVETAAQLARESRATLFLVHVMEFPMGADVAAESIYGSIEDLYKEQLQRLESWTPQNLGNDLAAQRAILRGSGTPAREIAEFARENNADLIVVGTHGRRGLGRLVMGSTAEGLLRWAPCKVLVVKPKVSVESTSSTRSRAETSDEDKIWARLT